MVPLLQRRLKSLAVVTRLADEYGTLGQVTAGLSQLADIQNQTIIELRFPNLQRVNGSTSLMPAVGF